MRVPHPLLFALLFSSLTFAQGRGDWWFFGQNAGIHFPNSANPVANVQGMLSTDEGCSSMSDENGKLLFYTNGIDVFDRDHIPMLNGLGLNGSWTSTQSALILPFPNDPLKFYIFTTFSQLSYSVVDISLNAGKGEVLSNEKNVLIATNVTEKLTAVLNASGDGYWVLAHEQDNQNFLAFEVTDAGISSSPVVSSLGVVHGNPYIGTMRVSPNRKKLAVVNGYNIPRTVELFNFDPATGVVSGGVELGFWDSHTPYGAEFSPNSELLYISEEGIPGGIYQYDINLATESAVNASEVRLAENIFVAGGALQLGPDDKIYHSRFGASYLGTIHSPNTRGSSCDYIEQAVNLNGKKCFLGLPNFIPKLFIARIETEYECEGDLTRLSIENNGVDSAHWNFGDMASDSANTASGLEVFHTFSEAGIYSVSLITFRDALIDTFNLEVVIHPEPPLDLGPDTVLCTGEELFLDVSVPGASYAWSDGSTDSISTIVSDQLVSVTVSETCEASDSLRVEFVDRPLLSIEGPQQLCRGETIELEVLSSGLDAFSWDNGSSDTLRLIDTVGTYTVLGEHLCGSDSVSINISNCECQVWIPNAFRPNDDGRNDTFNAKVDCNLVSWHLRIFDRWGQQCFSSRAASDGWDGYIAKERAPLGTYAWKLEYEHLVEGSKRPVFLWGRVTLLD